MKSHLTNFEFRVVAARCGRLGVMLCLVLLLVLSHVDTHAQTRRGAKSTRRGAGRSTIGKPLPATAETIFAATAARFLQDHDYEAARQGFLKAAALQPAFAPPRYNLAVLALKQEQWDEASKWFREYLQLDPGSKYAAQVEQALERLRKIKELEKTPEKYRELQYSAALLDARALLQAGKFSEAAAQALRARHIDEKRWEVYPLLATLLMRQGRFDEAVDMLERGTELAPAAQRMTFQAALERSKQGREYKQLLVSGTQALQANDHRRAAESFTKAWKIFPQHEQRGLQAATAWAISGDYAQSSTILETLLRSTDRSVVAKARELSDKVKPMSEAASALKRAPVVRAAAPLKDPLAAAGAELRAAEWEAERREAQALEEAQRRERRARELLNDAARMERLAEEDERAAREFDRQILSYSGQPGGQAAAESARSYAGTRRQDAERNRESARRLRAQAEQLGGAQP